MIRTGYFSSGWNWLELRPPRSISRYETGASLPSIKTLVKIAKILKKPATKYFGYFKLCVIHKSNLQKIYKHSK